MSNVKKFTQSLLGSKTSEAQNLMKVLKEEYGIEVGAAGVSVLKKNKAPLSRQQRRKHEREAQKKEAKKRLKKRG